MVTCNEADGCNGGGPDKFHGHRATRPRPGAIRQAATYPVGPHTIYGALWPKQVSCHSTTCKMTPKGKQLPGPLALSPWARVCRWKPWLIYPRNVRGIWEEDDSMTLPSLLPPIRLMDVAGQVDDLLWLCRLMCSGMPFINVQQAWTVQVGLTKKLFEDGGVGRCLGSASGLGLSWRPSMVMPRYITQFDLLDNWARYLWWKWSALTTQHQRSAAPQSDGG